MDGDGQVTDTPTVSGYTLVSSGAYHNCAVDDSGGIACWGIEDGSSQDHGQVSDAP